jgi:small-conductance mechanosensitive channel
MVMAQNEAELRQEKGPEQGQATERRIAWLTPLIGIAFGCTALALHRRDWVAGLVLGSVLAWFNFRWLARGLDALVGASIAQEGRPKPQVPLSTYFIGLFRYGLIGLCLYVIFTYLHVPLGSLIVGLCALGAAAVAASVYEILRPTA